MGADMPDNKPEKVQIDVCFDQQSEYLARLVAQRTAELSNDNARLRREIERRTLVEQALSKRQQALEAVYAIATAFRCRLEAMYDQIVLCLANILEAPYTAIAHQENGELRGVTVLEDGKLEHIPSAALRQHPCGMPCEERKTCVLKNVSEVVGFPLENAGGRYCSFAGVPVISPESDVQGAICAMDSADREFTDHDIHLMSIFARYVGHEIARRQLEGQLRQSQEMRLLGQLTSGVAHEVRNPLNALIAVTEALNIDLGDNEEYQPYIEHIRSQVSRLSILMQDLLQLGRPVNVHKLEALAAPAAVERAFESWRLSSVSSRRRVVIEAAPEADTSFIRIEQTRMHQVFQNLIDNACQHSPDDSEVSIVIAAPRDNRIRILVRDRGPGMPPEDLSKVFEPFFTKRKGGTGLGVTIVRGIVEQHGGTIRYYNNEPGPGLTAEITLPVA